MHRASCCGFSSPRRSSKTRPWLRWMAGAAGRHFHLVHSAAMEGLGNCQHRSSLGSFMRKIVDARCLPRRSGRPRRARAKQTLTTKSATALLPARYGDPGGDGTTDLQPEKPATTLDASWLATRWLLAHPSDGTGSHQEPRSGPPSLPLFSKWSSKAAPAASARRGINLNAVVASL